MTRFARARQVGDAVVDLALDAIADAVPAPSSPGVIRAVVVNTDAVERAQVVEAFIDLPIDSAEPWRKVDAQALDRPVDVLAARIDDHRASPPRRPARRVPDPRRGTARHARDEPLRNAVGAERAPPAPALVGAGAAAVRLRRVRSDDRHAPTTPAAGGTTAGQRRRRSSPRTSGSRCPSTTMARSRSATRRAASPITASRRSRMSATSATNTTTRRPAATAASPAPTRA